MCINMLPGHHVIMYVGEQNRVLSRILILELLTEVTIHWLEK